MGAVVDGKPDWCKRLDETQEAIDNVFLMENGIEYRIGKKRGEGSFGVILDGKRLSEGKSAPVAVNEPRQSDAPQLGDEYKSFKAAGIPGVYYFGQRYLHNVLIIDLLGQSLEELFVESGRKFSIKTVVSSARQMLRRIEDVHGRNLIYRDIKPENFLIGRPGTPTAKTIHLIDFGMAKQYQDPKTKQHIPYRERKSLAGTARYMSINTHLGQEQSRRDDLEALGHVFLYFLRGSLPWQGIKAATNARKYETIGWKKQETPIKDLCQALPNKFAEYLECVRGLGFEDPPDYEYLQRLLGQVLENAGQLDNAQFDWMEVDNARLKKLEIRLGPGPPVVNTGEDATANSSTSQKRRRIHSVPTMVRPGPGARPQQHNLSSQPLQTRGKTSMDPEHFPPALVPKGR